LSSKKNVGEKTSQNFKPGGSGGLKKSIVKAVRAEFPGDCSAQAATKWPTRKQGKGGQPKGIKGWKIEPWGNGADVPAFGR